VPGLDGDDDDGGGGHATHAWLQLAAAMLEKGCGGTLESVESVWDGAVRLQRLLAAMCQCDVVAVDDGEDAHPDVACRSTAVLPSHFGWPFCGLLTSACVKHGSGVSGR